MCWFEAQRFRAYPLEILAGVFSRVAEVLLYGTFWIVVGQFSPSGSINPQDIIGYYLIISGLTPFFYAGFGIAGLMSSMIKNGELSQALIRPINPIIYPWALRTGRNFINLVFGLLQVVIGIIISGGLRVEALPFLLPVLLNTAALNAAFNILIGAGGFYTTDGNGLKNAFLHLASFLRGEKMPIYLMEPGFAHLLMLTPFPASMYHLATVFHGTHLPEWGDVLVGSAWAITLLWVSIKVWKSGLRRYEAIGI
jgi:ABC-type uncharacterized transport system permease subunit